VTGSNAELIWISTPRLLDAGVDPWMGIPLWVADPDRETVHQADISWALAAGLTFRPLPRIIRDTLSWDLARVSCQPRDDPGSCWSSVDTGLIRRTRTALVSVDAHRFARAGPEQSLLSYGRVVDCEALNRRFLPGGRGRLFWRPARTDSGFPDAWHSSARRRWPSKR
jgi:hypothetical protein